MKKINKTKIKINGMHCSSCAMNIDFELEDLPGVNSARTSYARQEIDVEYDETKIKLSQIIEKIQKLGYKVVSDQ